MSARRVFRNARALTEDEFSALIARCLWMGNAAGARDAAVIAVLCGGRLNRVEAAALDVSDLDEEGETVHVRGREGFEGRRVVVEGIASVLLRDWLALRGTRAGRLFLKIDTMGREVLDKPFLPHNIAEIVRRRATEAGIGPVKVSDLHATALAVLFDEGRGTDGGSDPGEEPVRSSMPQPDRLLLSSAARFLASPWGTGVAAASQAASEALNQLTREELGRLRSRADTLLMQRRVSEVARRPENEREQEAREIQRWVVRANEQGVPANELARLIGIHPRTVSHLANSAKNGTLASSRKPVFLFGRERKFDSEARRLLEADLEAYPAATIDQRCEYLEGVLGTKVSRNLIASEISRLGFRYVREAGFGPKRSGRWVRFPRATLGDDAGPGGVPPH